MTQDTNTTPQGQVPEAIAGALFDFAGFLTTLPKERAVTLSGAHLATPVVDLLTEWAETRGLNLDEANVKGWVAALTAAPADTNTTSGAADLLAMVSKALREAYNLGQRYWQQADSEYISQHKKADDTRAKFLALVEETCAALAAGQATAAQAAHVGAVESNTADAAPTQGATEMENLQRTAVGWQGRALRAERNWAVCRRWAIAGGAPVEKLGDDPDQPLPPAPGPADGESNG